MSGFWPGRDVILERVWILRFGLSFYESVLRLIVLGRGWLLRHFRYPWSIRFVLVTVLVLLFTFIFPSYAIQNFGRLESDSEEETLFASEENFYSHDIFPEVSISYVPPVSACSDRDSEILEIFSYVEAAGFSGGDLSVGVAVVLAESDGRASALNRNSNGSVDRGLFQINSVHRVDESRIFDPWYNAEVAFRVWASSGWRAWYAHTPRGGSYGSGERFIRWKPIVDCVEVLRNG